MSMTGRVLTHAETGSFFLLCSLKPESLRGNIFPNLALGYLSWFSAISVIHYIHYYFYNVAPFSIFVFLNGILSYYLWFFFSDYKIKINTTWFIVAKKKMRYNGCKMPASPSGV